MSITKVIFSYSIKALGFIILIILTQDIYIFPGAFLSKFQSLWKRKAQIPPQVESEFISTADGKNIELWRYEPEVKSELDDYCAIIFHGNGRSLENFIFVQMWLAELGIKSYGFDYRGFGRSSGWPSEKGIYRDSDAVYEYVKQKENITAKNIIIVGVSIGSAPAARIAALHDPRLLLLSSAFTDLKSAARNQKLIGFLAPFIRHKFPTMDYVKKLKSTDLILAHGLEDKKVPPDHSEQLELAYEGTGKVKRHTSKDAGHNSVFYDLRKVLKSNLFDWL